MGNNLQNQHLHKKPLISEIPEDNQKSFRRKKQWVSQKKMSEDDSHGDYEYGSGSHRRDK